MAGWEQLTPNQIMTIAQIGLISVSIYTVGTIIKSFINWRISKTIQIKIDKLVDDSVNQMNLVALIRKYREKRKARKEKENALVLSGYDPMLEKLSR